MLLPVVRLGKHTVPGLVQKALQYFEIGAVKESVHLRINKLASLVMQPQKCWIQKEINAAKRDSSLGN